MSPFFYGGSRLACNFIKFQCFRVTVLHPERADQPGGRLLACTHISHLEPFIVAAHLQRNVRWMARIEFFRWWWGAALLRKNGAFPVDRFGPALPGIRRAIQLVNTNEIVGIFPEGGVAQGKNSLLRGGPMKQGVSLIALRTNKPIVPVVVLGSEKLTRVTPWIPPRRTHLYIAFGREVIPPVLGPADRLSNRNARHELTERLRAEYISAYHELLAHTGLTDQALP